MRTALGIVLLLPMLAGCGSGKTLVHGQVTYKGIPVAEGHIAFHPVDGKGLPQGTDIINGEYELYEVSPGQKRVVIQSEHAPRLVAGTSKELPHIEMDAPGDPIPADAINNNQEVKIGGAEQVLNFDLQPPSASKQR